MSKVWQISLKALTDIKFFNVLTNKVWRNSIDSLNSPNLVTPNFRHLWYHLASHYNFLIMSFYVHVSIVLFGQFPWVDPGRVCLLYSRKVSLISLWYHKGSR